MDYLDTCNYILGSDINGCLTGSSYLLCTEPELHQAWTNTADIDIFVYSLSSMIDALRQLHNEGFKPGKGTEVSKAEENWKWQMMLENPYPLSASRPLQTVSMTNDAEVTVNVSARVWQDTVVDVVQQFDMSIIMGGIDIRSGLVYDQRLRQVLPKTCRITAPWQPASIGNYTEEQLAITALPNAYKVATQGINRFSNWNVAKWCRQFSRCDKYYNRGFDTRPMGEFYLYLLAKSIEQGELRMFDRDKNNLAHQEFLNEYVPIGKYIAAWLEARNVQTQDWWTTVTDRDIDALTTLESKEELSEA